MLSPADLQSASDLLRLHWETGRRLRSLPPRLRPANRAEAYAIQALLEAGSRTPLFGWKIAATSAAGQAHINVDGPLAGRLLAERVHESGAELPFAANHMRVAEAEFAFRMARALPPRAAAYSREEVLDAVGALHPSIEIPDSRYEDFTAVDAPQLIADNSCAHLFVLGPAAPAVWHDSDLARFRMRGSVTGASGTLEREGVGANVLGDPLVALAWLANELSSLGVMLRAGQVVTTGTCLIPFPIQPGDHVVADFGILGQVSCRIV